VLLVVGVVSVAYALAFLRFHAIDPIAAARKAVLKQMNEGLFALDLQGRIVDLNPMAAAILGIPENNLRGKPLTEVMPTSALMRLLTAAQSKAGGPGRDFCRDLRLCRIGRHGAGDVHPIQGVQAIKIRGSDLIDGSFSAPYLSKRPHVPSRLYPETR